MPDENKDKVAEAIENLNKKFEEKAKFDHEQFSALDSKVSSLKGKEEEKDEKADFDWDSDDDAEEPIKKSELKDFGEKIAKEATERARKEVLKEVEVKTTRSSRDSQAMHDFSWLNQESKGFSAKGFDAVAKEMKARIARGRSSDDPDLLYDAALTVERQGKREGWIATHQDAEDAADQAARRGENFSVKKRDAESRDKPTAEQIEYAKKFKLDEKRFAQHYGKTSKGRVFGVDFED